MQLPPEYHLTNKLNEICKLKQLPRASFGHFIKAMIDLKYRRARGDHALFIKHSVTRIVIVFLVYIDDILITR